jgi:hypothetical protein
VLFTSFHQEKKLMIQRSLAAMMSALLLCSMVVAQTPIDKHARFTQRVKEAVRGLGTGPQAKLRMRLRDTTPLKGYVRAAGEDNFELLNTETGVAMSIPYSQVKKLKGHGVSLGSTFPAKDAARIGGLVLTLAFPVILLKAGGPD